MTDKTSFTAIEKIGREKLIEKLLSYSSGIHSEIATGLGDDAAVINEGDERSALLSQEVYVEGVDFDLSYTPLKHLGYKIMTGGVSDVYAMNGQPKAVLIGLAVPNRISVEMIEECYQGIQAACRDYDADIAGGDITATRGPFVITVSVFGTIATEELVFRSGASADEAICVTGNLGSAMAGLRILLREKKFWMESGEEDFQPDLEEYEYVVRRQLMPAARYDLINILKEEHIVPTSMIDLSQGLMNSLKQLTDKSAAGAIIYEAALPIVAETRSVAGEMKEEAEQYALHGGEDYEMIFTLAENEVNRLAGVFRDFVVIGKITGRDEGLRLQKANGDVWSYDENQADLNDWESADKN